MSEFKDLDFFSPQNYEPLQSLSLKKLNFFNCPSNSSPLFPNSPLTPSYEENKSEPSAHFEYYRKIDVFEEDIDFNFLYPENNINIPKELNLPIPNSSTNFKTIVENEKQKVPIFNVITRPHKESDNEEKRQHRLDYAIKNFKVACVKYIKDYANNLLKQCNFKFKLFTPSYNYFTGNSNIRDNKVFLEFTIEKIFSYSKHEKKNDKKTLQKKNMDLMKQIKSCLRKKKIKKGDCYDKLQNFLQMTFEEAIMEFYKSKEFLEFSSQPKTLELDKIVMQVRDVSLLEPNGFLRI